jgi:hypothetical protein
VENADIVVSENGRSGIFALDPATGKDHLAFALSQSGVRLASGAPCFNA